MLYLAMGDGGGVNCGDVEPNAPQDVSSLFGKILRLDLTQPAPYGALDNPFVGSGDARVWHYGLRNPFRFSFDRLNGDLYVGDVGQNRYEEIDYAPRGASGLNFGWAPYEGSSRDTCPSRELRAGSTHTAPIFVADRRAGATNPFADYNAMIGGVVYRGQALPQLYGAYLFGGYRSQRLGALYQCGSVTSAVTPILKSCNINEPNSACMRRLDGSPQLSELRAIVEDHDGEMYVVANGNSLLKVVANQ
jgi:glucose/arabinose dehydrogenase